MAVPLWPVLVALKRTHPWGGEITKSAARFCVQVRFGLQIARNRKKKQTKRCCLGSGHSSAHLSCSGRSESLGSEGLCRALYFFLVVPPSPPVSLLPHQVTLSSPVLQQEQGAEVSTVLLNLPGHPWAVCSPSNATVSLPFSIPRTWVPSLCREESEEQSFPPLPPPHTTPSFMHTQRCLRGLHPTPTRRRTSSPHHHHPPNPFFLLSLPACSAKPGRRSRPRRSRGCTTT